MTLIEKLIGAKEPSADRFRITSNGLWFRVEYKAHDGWCAVQQVECFSNIHNRFDTLEAAKAVYDYLAAGNNSFEFMQAWP